MKKKLVWVLGIVAALVIGSAIGYAGSRGGSTIGPLPLFLACGLFAFTIQWLAFIPAYLFQTERYFDLTGSITYITLALFALSLSSMEPGAIAITTMVLIWAVRLGTFLFSRVSKVGHDSRFRAIMPDFLQYLMTWTLQGLWVFVTFAAGLAALASGREHPVDVFVVVGSLIWLTGFTIEVVADRQKTAFRARPENKDQFINEGLWAMSRHPNYFGEIMLWTGIAVVAFPVLEGPQLVTLISPVFVYVLMTKVSGVRMLAHRGQKQWGREPEYQAYIANTPMLIPNPFRGSTS